MFNIAIVAETYVLLLFLRTNFVICDLIDSFIINVDDPTSYRLELMS